MGTTPIRAGFADRIREGSDFDDLIVSVQSVPQEVRNFRIPSYEGVRVPFAFEAEGAEKMMRAKLQGAGSVHSACEHRPQASARQAGSDGLAVTSWFAFLSEEIAASMAVRDCPWV